MEPFLSFLMLIIVGIVAGVLVWIIRTAPFIPAIIKQVGAWLIIVLAVLFILYRAFPLFGVSL